MERLPIELIQSVGGYCGDWRNIGDGEDAVFNSTTFLALFGDSFTVESLQDLEKLCKLDRLYPDCIKKILFAFFFNEELQNTPFFKKT